MLDRRSTVIALVLGLVGCTSTYQVRFETDRWPAARAEVEECLSSIGFGDVSGEDFYPEFMQEDPTIMAVWKPVAERTFIDTRPFAVAWVIDDDGEMFVHFVPGNSAGYHADFFAEKFSHCIIARDSEARIKTTSRTIFPDLR
jgi:hypothetical protein